ncbi:hypothetical protein COCON_G00057280 [Conger conger]|uniref:Uncharacterized protein n=1 Tax=Conger conger TaxID=82655 RepID=A0A9Q1DQL6_CONCO|nr:hypothetical protein COCON_G00057280 [Conger conger]
MVKKTPTDQNTPGFRCRKKVCQSLPYVEDHTNRTTEGTLQDASHKPRISLKNRKTLQTSGDSAYLDDVGIAVVDGVQPLSLHQAVHLLLQRAHPLLDPLPVLLQLLRLLPELGGDVEHLVLPLLQRPGFGPQRLAVLLQSLRLPAQVAHRAVEGLELGGDVPHLALCLVHVLLQAVTQLQEPVGDDVHVVPGGEPPALILPRGRLPLEGVARRGAGQEGSAEHQAGRDGLHLHRSVVRSSSLTATSWCSDSPDSNGVNFHPDSNNVTSAGSSIRAYKWMVVLF